MLSQIEKGKPLQKEIQMKVTMAVLFSLCNAISLSAREDIVSCEKTYVVLNQMHFTDSSFFIEIDELWVQPASLNIDASGFYFTAIRHEEYIPGPWQCPKRGCLTWNEEWRDYCKKCGNQKQG